MKGAWSLEGEPKMGSDNQRRNKTLVKVGGGSGGGVVLLLGGALATAAFITAFIRRRGWSKDNYRHHRHNNNPRLQSGKQDEREEKNRGEHFAVMDQSSNGYGHHSSSGETELTVPKNATDISTQDGKESRAEINAGIILCETGGQSVVSTIPKILENCADLEVSVVMHEGFRSLGEKLPSEPQNLISDGETKIPLIKQDDLDKSTKAIVKDFDRDYTEEEVKTQNDPSDNDKDKSGAESDNTIEAVVHSEWLEAEKNVDKEEGPGEDKSGEAIKKIEDNEDGQGTAPPTSVPVNDDDKEGTEIMEKVGVDQVIEESHKEGALPTEIVEKIGESLKLKQVHTETMEVVGVDGAIEGSHGDGDGAGYVGEELVEKQETCDHVIVLEKSAGVGSNGEETDVRTLQREEWSTCEEDNGENACTAQVTETQEDRTLKQCAHEEDDPERNTGKEVEEEVILSPQHVIQVAEITEAKDRNGDMLMSSSLQNAVVDEEVKGEDINNKAALSSNKAQEPTSVGTANSFSVEMEEDHVTQPAESLQEPSNLIVRQVEGKIQLDAAAAMKEETPPLQSQECKSKYAIMKLLVKLKEQRMTVLMGALSLLSSLSCSWFFGLSFAKLCTVLFLTMLLSKSMCN